MSISRTRKQPGILSRDFPGKIVYAVTVFLLVVCITFALLKSFNYFPIRDVKVFGIQRLDHGEVQELISPLVTKGFFGVDVDRIKERVLQLPWAAQVVVRRTWPDLVIVTITERTPVAIWNDGSLLSSTGELFTPPADSYPTGLPQFVGPAGEQIMMSEYYTKFSDVLIPLHFKISRLELTPAMTWSLTLNNGIKLSIGHKDVLTRLSHFVKVYPKIVGDRVADVDYFDLRYPNGMAVHWKTAT